MKSFVVPSCPCGDEGIMMTDVVFFGDNVPKERVDAVKSEVAKASALLVVGSSLYVFSGYRWEMMSVRLVFRRGIYFHSFSDSSYRRKSWGRGSP